MFLYRGLVDPQFIAPLITGLSSYNEEYQPLYETAYMLRHYTNSAKPNGFQWIKNFQPGPSYS